MADTWEALEQACGQCRNCALAETRLHVVFGDGARDAEILLVGEGPGQREDEQGIPFVGPAGLLLDDMLEIIGLDRTKVYVANIVKCRPPRNRDPLNVEQDACIGWLRRQTALLRPKLIVCLGRIAAKAIIKEDFKITAEHGKWFQRGGVQMTAIYHPSALLRDARGNSGVILSLLFRGMSKVFKGLTEADGAQLASAMQEGVSTAYGAVMKPAGKARGWCCAAAALCCLLAVAGCLLWTPTHYDTLYGLQGRYFLPVLPALLLTCLPRRLAAVPDEASAQARLTGALALVQWGVILNIMLAVIAR